MTDVLDHGRVELIRTMGDDLAIVNAAQASFNRESDTYGERERRILRRLIKDEHGVPFEHVVLTYKVKLPLFLAAQFKKHRMGSWSEHSARYSEMEPEFYIPNPVRVQVGKPMDYEYMHAPPLVAQSFRDSLNDLSMDAVERYRHALALNVAKEHARLLLPVNMYTTVVWTLNLRSLFNFLHLRMDPHAQHEAQVYARAMYSLALEVAPDTLTAWSELGEPKP